MGPRCTYGGEWLLASACGGEWLLASAHGGEWLLTSAHGGEWLLASAHGGEWLLTSAHGGEWLLTSAHGGEWVHVEGSGCLQGSHSLSVLFIGSGPVYMLCCNMTPCVTCISLYIPSLTTIHMSILRYHLMYCNTQADKKRSLVHANDHTAFSVLLSGH